MKNTIGFLLATVLVLSSLGNVVSAAAEEGAPETVRFVDSAGRVVEVPRRIERVAVSGPLAQIAVFALCPDGLVGVAVPWDQTAALYLSPRYYMLAQLGQVYGGKTMNLESLLESGAQVVIDVGEPKEGIAEDLDALEEQVGIPFVHITATLSTMGDAYRLLGALMDMEEEAEALAAYCEAVYAQIHELAACSEKVRLIYLTGEKGLQVIAKGSYHAEVIDLLSDNLAVVPDPSSRGSGNEVDMEQILLWNPEVILFSPGSAYAGAGEDAVWLQLDAVRSGRYYETPFGPDNWLGFPPSSQRCLGMLWMAKLLYPEAAQYDLYQAVKEYYRLFCHCDLTRAQYEALVANSLDRREE